MKTQSSNHVRPLAALTLAALSVWAPLVSAQQPLPSDAERVITSPVKKINRGQAKQADSTAPTLTTNLAPVAPATTVGGPWTALGPAPTRNGQVTAGPNNEICGAISAIAAHPSNADILYIGSVGGGVWKTINATNAAPTWVPLTDAEGSQNIGALEFDSTDGTSQTLVAGIARVSSFASRGGALIGVLRTTNGGASWTNLGAATFANENITSVAARGAIILAASDDAQAGAGSGLFRSTNTGGVFTLLSGAGGTGLSAGPVSDLVADPNVSTRFYAAVATVGIFRSDDTGATWTNITGTITGISGTTTKIEMAVHNNGVTNALYVGVINAANTLASVWRSANPTAGAPAWTQMDTPVTHNGAQGNLHFSIVASKTNANVVYLGGDRIAGAPFTGNLFRGDASLGLGTQFTTIMGANANNGAGSGNTTPHADSREMVFDANGTIIEGDDGGLYRRSSPTSSTGIWTSVMGNLACFESHDVAWDALSNIAMNGAQDNGTHIQTATGSTIWTSISGGDGGDVAIDDTSSATQSIRYGSSQNLGNFYRKTYNAAGGLVSTVLPALTVLSAGPAIVPQFVTPVELNRVTPTRLLIGGANTVYESLDQGGSVTALSGGTSVNRMALTYGGRQAGVPNADVLYYGSGSTVRRRTTAGGAISATPTPFPGSTVQDVILDSNDWTRVYAADSSAVYFTPDSGTTWQNITGNLTNVGIIRCLEFFNLNGAPCVAAGTGIGVYVSFVSNPTVWARLGTGMPNVVAFDMSYNPTDNVLLVGTLGRSVYKMDLLSVPTPIFSGGGNDLAAGPTVGSTIGTYDFLKSGAVLASNGALAFRGLLTVGSGAPPVTATDFTGMWRSPDGTTANTVLIARTDNTAPDTGAGGKYILLPYNPILSTNGLASFVGQLKLGVGSPSTTATTDTAVWSEQGGGGMKMVVREGDTLPGTPGPLTRMPRSAVVASSAVGHLAFGVTHGATSSLIRATVSGGSVGIEVLGQQGAAAPGGSTFNDMNLSSNDPRMDAAGDTAFLGFTVAASNNAGVFYRAVGSPTTVLLAHTGSAAPSTAENFTGFEWPTLSNGGLIAFRAFTPTLNGIWKGDADTPASIVLVLKNGNTLPGTPGGQTINSIWSPFSNPSGKIAFRVSHIGGPTEDRAIASDTDGTLKIIAKVGDVAPGLGADTFANFDHPIIGANNQVAFSASTAGGASGVWQQAPNGGTLHLVLKIGDSITTTGPVVRQIASFSIPGITSGDRKNEQTCMDTNGHILIQVGYADGSTGLLLTP